MKVSGCPLVLVIWILGWAFGSQGRAPRSPPGRRTARIGLGARWVRCARPVLRRRRQGRRQHRARSEQPPLREQLGADDRSGAVQHPRKLGLLSSH